MQCEWVLIFSVVFVKQADVDDSPPKEAYELKVCNTVHTLVMDRVIELRNAATVLKGRYARDIFTAVSFRIKDPFTTLSLFDSGQQVITGATNYMNALESAWLINSELWEKLGIAGNLYNLNLQNVVGSLALGYKLNLDLFFVHNKTEASYNPELFPGLHFFPKDSNVVLMLFTSGAVVITGAENVDHLFAVYEDLKHIFIQYKLGAEQLEMPAKSRRSRPDKMRKSETAQSAKAQRKQKRQKV